MSRGHIPVLAERVAAILLESGGNTFLDATIGGGGHSLHLVKKAPLRLRLFAIDLDPHALEAARDKLSGLCDFHPLHGNFAELSRFCQFWGVDEFDGIIADLGLSSLQLDANLRGFSHRFDASLDLRYDPNSPNSAADLINLSSQREIKAIIQKFGGERRAAAIAAEICRRRPLKTTGDLKRAVLAVSGIGHIEKTLARVFQAFRVAVNDELGSLERFLPSALTHLKPGSRLAVISYESETDRRVKEFFRLKARGCICPPNFPVCQCSRKPEIKVLTPKPLIPDEAEISINPRARSAKLRAAEKCPDCD